MSEDREDSVEREPSEGIALVTSVRRVWSMENAHARDARGFSQWNMTRAASVNRKKGSGQWKCLLLTASLIAAFPISSLYRWHKASAPFVVLGGRVLTTGDGMGAILGPSGVISVDLSHTAVGDVELDGLVEDMKGLNNLQSLRLRGTRVTNAGLTRLRSLGDLRSIDVSASRVTKEGIRQLGRSHPKLEVWCDACPESQSRLNR